MSSAARTPLHGAIAAMATPLTDGGSTLDEAGVGPLLGFLAGGGLDGALVCGTTGESMLLTVDERRRLLERCMRERRDGFLIAVHAGAQSTADTVALAAHARDAGADAVAVIAPPFFPLDGDELFAHLGAAAAACDPVPFYIYEFAARSGYPIPIPVIERMRTTATNLAGLKVSDTPIEAVEPYLLDGLDVFVGLEPVVLAGMERGAVGAVSGLATAFPDLVARLVHDRDPGAHERVVALRAALSGIPFHAAMKHLLRSRGIISTEDARPPLRPLNEDERARVDALLEPA